MEGGKLGEIRKGVLYTELEEHLFSMKSGQLSGIVESPLGFHLLYCELIRAEKKVGFDELKNKLRTSLIQRKRSSKERAWLAGLMKKQLIDKHSSEIKQEKGLRSESRYV